MRLECETEVAHLEGDLNKDADELSRSINLDTWEPELRISFSVRKLLDFSQYWKGVPKNSPWQERLRSCIAA